MAFSPPTKSSRPATREALIRAGVVAWALIGVLGLVLFGLWILYQIRDIFPPLVLALALIFLMNPIVSRLERRGVKRGLATLIIYLVFVVAIFLIGLALSPPLGRQVGELRERLPDLQESVIGLAEDVASRLGISFESARIQDALAGVPEQVFLSFSQILSFAGGAAHIVLIFVLAPIIAAYLIVDLPRLGRSFTSFLPARYRDEWLMLLEKCGQAVGGFFRGQLVVAAIVAVMSSVALLIAGIPFWLPIGILAGFFNLIPLIGPFVGGAVAVIVGAVDGGLGRAAAAAAAMIVVQQIDNHFISPKVMARTLRLHPVTIIMALLAGGTVAGLWGMLLAVPGTAVAKVLFMHYYTTHILTGDSQTEAAVQAPQAAGVPGLTEEAMAGAPAGEESERPARESSEAGLDKASEAPAEPPAEPPAVISTGTRGRRDSRGVVRKGSRPRRRPSPAGGARGR